MTLLDELIEIADKTKNKEVTPLIKNYIWFSERGYKHNAIIEYIKEDIKYLKDYVK